SVASRSDLFFDVRNSAGLFAVYDRLASQLLETRLRRMEITDVLPDNMRYVADSADPAPAEQDGQTLKWNWTVLDTKGITVSYQVEPLEEGVWPTNLYALADFWDTEGRIGHGEFPTPTVEVRVPTATPTPPSTATPEPTNTPRATATAVPRPVFLPVILWERCDPTVLSTDVALVIDISSSMEGPTRAGGRPKREAARRAALAFLDLLGPDDQAALVVFSEDARRLVPLGTDRRALRRALAELPRSRGTRIDAGLAMAVDVLTGPERNADHTPAILLLTDGRPTRSSEADVRGAAARARRAGLTVFAIGLGGDVNPGLLRDVAGDPGRYYPAPRSDDLAGVYRRIAGVIPCPRERHKWGEPWP
ncbi:MAG: VWA domain-containing protein, partial [Anaerolineae bacterium]